jgi:hypothetical protein
VRKRDSTLIWRAEKSMLESILGPLVWILANVAYGAYVRDGERGFKRLAAFCLGFPLTLCSSFFMAPTSRLRQPMRDELEEERALLLEIRRDRARRLSQSPAPRTRDRM